MPRVSTKQLTKLPSSEDGTGVTCKTLLGETYYISQSIEKRKHTLWKIIDGNYQKIATANSPYDLYEKIDWGKCSEEDS